MRRNSGRPFLPPSLEGGGDGSRVPPITGGCSTPARRRALALLATLATTIAAPLWAREVVDASAPVDLAVTIYRDPDRGEGDELDADDPRGLAMISETRRVTLPAGESTIRFEGVAEGMIGVSAIVTGLPGGTIEKNRNAQLLSPAALVDGTLGNRVTITRMNPGTGVQTSETAVVRTRADGGLVLQTGLGFEAVQCSGLPETLTYNRIPAGLSAQPVFSVDTRSAEGGTYDVTLTYLAWGFDWQADYVGRISGKPSGEQFEMGLLSWLTLVNDNGQSFDNAKLQIIAGELNVESDYEGLADPPVAEGLYLECYPIGSTSAGLMPPPPPPPAPPPPPGYAASVPAEMIVVTGARLRSEALMDAPVSVITAEEEDLGDLKLFRVPGRVDVAAKGMKQVAFLNKDAVKARLLYQTGCNPDGWIGEGGDPVPAEVLLVTKNEDKQGLGIALPQGAMTLYEPTSGGERLGATTSLRDYARGQDIELELPESRQVFARCAAVSRTGRQEGRKWTAMRSVLTNANPHPVIVRLQLGWGGAYDIRFPGAKVVVKNGYQTVEVTVPANAEKTFDWRLRDKASE